MFPYIFIIIILLIGTIAEVFGIKKNAKIYFVISTILIALFAGLRYNTGADWSIYEPAFYEMPELGNIENWELAYYWINLLFYYVFGNYYVLQFAASAFLMYSVGRFLWKNTDYPMFSLLLFFMMFTNNGILLAQVRQSIAVAIILFGYEYILNRSLGKYLILVLFACLFHISAIMALPLYLMTRKIPNFILVSLILLFQIFYFVPEITAYIVKFFLPFMPERLENIGQVYVNHILYGNKIQFNTGIYYLAGMLLSIIVILSQSDKTREKSFLLNSLVIAMIIGAMSTSMPILGRFKAYYLIFAISAYPLIFNLKITKIELKATSLIMMLLFFCYFYIPFHEKLTSQNIDPLTQRATNYSWNPYYNVIHHSKEAENRKDWTE